MDDEEFRVSKDLVRTISVDTRADILKALDKRQMTASELSRYLNKHVTTIHEHLGVLSGSSLIEKIERPGRKWIYYKLTKSGKKILHPESYRLVFVFSALFFLILSSFYVSSLDLNPGHPLYGLKRGRENIEIFFIRGDIEKAGAHFELADRRLQEAKVEAKIGRTFESIELIGEYRREIIITKELIKRAKDRDLDVSGVSQNIIEEYPRHQLIISNLINSYPELESSLKPAINQLDESQKIASAGYYGNNSYK